MSRAALFWIFVYVRDLFIGYSYKSSIAIVQSWHDHGRKKLFCETVRQKRTDRRDSPEFKKRSAAEAIDVLFHWQCLVKVHSKVRNGGLERNVTSIYICRLAADRTDTHWWFTSIISVFSVLSFSLLLCIHDKVSLIQDWMLDWAEVKSQGGALSEISVSSAYLW